MLIDADVRAELTKVNKGIKAAGESVRQAPEVKDLRKMFVEEIPALKTKLLAQLRALVDAIDSEQRPDLRPISTLIDPLTKAIQEIGPPGGSPPGVADSEVGG